MIGPHQSSVEAATGPTQLVPRLRSADCWLLDLRRSAGRAAFKLGQARQERSNSTQALWSGVIVRPLVSHLFANEPGFHQLRQVVREGGLADPEAIGHVAGANARAAVRGNVVQQLHSDRIGQHLEGGGEAIGFGIEERRMR